MIDIAQISFSEIILALSQVTIAYLTKKQITSADAEIRMLKSMQADSQMDITRLKACEKENKESHSFRQEVYNAITETAALKIIEEESIYSHEELSDALTAYFNELPDFALTFYYSTFRNNVRVTKKYLYRFIKKGLNAEFSKLITAVKKSITEEKCQVVGNSKHPVNFFEMLEKKAAKEPTIFDLNELLINRLVDNGIKEAELKTIFVNYTYDFLQTFKERFIDFNRLKEFELDI